jgi:hypothetical protein
LHQDLSALDTSQLKRFVDQLRSELREAEAELWRRTAVRLATFPPHWADPPTNMLAAIERDDFLEGIHSALQRQLPASCRLGRGVPATEIWGPEGALGANPAHRLRELVAQVREELEHREEGQEPWR